MPTFTAMFESRADAERLQKQLEQMGIIDTDGVGIHDQDSSGFSKDQYSTQEDKGFWAGLKDAFLPDEDRHTYEEGVRRGHFLLTVKTDEQNADRVHGLLEDSNAVDVDEKSASWKNEGWTAPIAGAAATAGAAVGMSSKDNDRSFGSSSDKNDRSFLGSTGGSDQSFIGSSDNDRSTLGTTGSNDRSFTSGAGNDEQRLQIVEEQLAVGKREVNRGGVRVRSYVTEKPVQEQVNLREEHVHVERHPVDQPLGVAGLGADAFQERDITLTETAEEAVVAKNARVVEEVVVSKDVDNRTETVSDTVRRTDVDIEQLGTSGTDNDRSALFNKDGDDRSIGGGTDRDGLGIGSDRDRDGLGIGSSGLGSSNKGSDYNR